MTTWEMKSQGTSSRVFCMGKFTRSQSNGCDEAREIEARARPRQRIHSKCKYRFASDTDYRDCFLVDLSQVGAFIIVDNKLPIESFINVKIESDNADEQPIAFSATIVREEIKPDGKQFGYGCEILDIDDGIGNDD